MEEKQPALAPIEFLLLITTAAPFYRFALAAPFQWMPSGPEAFFLLLLFSISLILQSSPHYKRPLAEALARLKDRVPRAGHAAPSGPGLPQPRDRSMAVQQDTGRTPGDVAPRPLAVLGQFEAERAIVAGR